MSKDNFTLLNEIGRQMGVTPAELVTLQHIMYQESKGIADAKCGTSSATGLFQFTEQTWLTTLNDNGAKHGYGRYAAAISKNADGKCVVTDPKLKQEILDLRKNPEASIRMGIELMNDNASALGAGATAGDLYLAHFLGAAGAKRVMGTNPTTDLQAMVDQGQMKAGVLSSNKDVRLNLHGKTVYIKDFTAGDLRQWASVKMGQEIDYESIDELERQRRRAERARKQHVTVDDVPEARGDMTFSDIVGFVFASILSSIFGSMVDKPDGANLTPANTPPAPRQSAPAVALKA